MALKTLLRKSIPGHAKCDSVGASNFGPICDPAPFNETEFSNFDPRPLYDEQKIPVITLHVKKMKINDPLVNDGPTCEGSFNGLLHCFIQENIHFLPACSVIVSSYFSLANS